MNNRQWYGSLIFMAFSVSLVPATAAETTIAAIDFGVGRGGSASQFTGCRDLNQLISRNWLQIRDLLAPDYTEKKRPRRNQFECIDPGYTRGLSPHGGMRGSGLLCFRPNDPNGRGICCDDKLSSCAYFKGQN